ncbi:hypothetical protein ACHAPO_012026 [Fusarium lateritium]
MSVKNIYIDDSNLAIGGMKLHNRLAATTCVDWSYDITELNRIIMQQCGFNIFGARRFYVYGANLRRNDQLNHFRAENVVYGYDCPRNSRGREKEADVTLAIDMTAHAKIWSDAGMPCDIVLVSGDGDFFPAAVKALELGSNVHIWSWRSSLSQSFRRLEEHLENRPLYGVGQIRIHELDTWLDQLTRSPM